MRSTFIALLLMGTVSGAAAPASSQDAPTSRSSLHQSGCVDFSAEYMGCLSFGPPPESEKFAVREDPNQLHACL